VKGVNQRAEGRAQYRSPVGMILQECATGLRRPPGVKYAGYEYKILLACAEDVPAEH